MVYFVNERTLSNLERDGADNLLHSSKSTAVIAMGFSADQDVRVSAYFARVTVNSGVWAVRLMLMSEWMVETGRLRDMYRGNEHNIRFA